jgi:exopolysaccharide production protein ExoQ
MTSLIDPKRPSSAGVEGTSIIWCIAVLSFPLLMLAEFIGPIGPYLFSGLWMLVGAFTLRTSIQALFFRWQIWAFAAFALISAIWSPIPVLTIRYSLELALTIGVAALAAYHLPPRKIVTATSCSFFLVAVCSVVFGRWGYDYLANTPVFMGVFASKNQLAFFTNQMLLANLAIVGDSEYKFKTRLINMMFAIFAIYLVVVTRSASAWVLSVLGACILFANFKISRLKKESKIIHILILCAALLLIAIIVFIILNDDTSYILNLVGKDTTLTGRTFLWERALSLIPQRPILGVGFGAFWQPNFPEAENLWRMFRIPNPSGFHFHNTYFETTIELGIIGCSILMFFIGTTLANLCRWSWSERSMVSSYFLATLITFLVRSFVEVEIILEFYIGTVLYYICMYCGYRYGRRV